MLFRISQLSTGTYGIARRDILPTSLAGDTPVSLEAQTAGSTYQWEIIQPPGSSAAVVNPTSQICTVAAENVGGYIAKLTTDSGLPTEDVSSLYFGIPLAIGGADYPLPALNETIQDNSIGHPMWGWAEKIHNLLLALSSVGTGAWTLVLTETDTVLAADDTQVIYATGNAAGTPSPSPLVTFTLPTASTGLPAPGSKYAFIRSHNPTFSSVSIQTTGYATGRILTAASCYPIIELNASFAGSSVVITYIGLIGAIPYWSAGEMEGIWYPGDTSGFGQYYTDLGDPYDIWGDGLIQDNTAYRSYVSPFMYDYVNDSLVHPYRKSTSVINASSVTNEATGNFSFVYGDYSSASTQFSFVTGRGARARWYGAQVNASNIIASNPGEGPTTFYRGSSQNVTVQIQGVLDPSISAVIYLSPSASATFPQMVTGADAGLYAYSVDAGTGISIVGQLLLVGTSAFDLAFDVAYKVDFLVSKGVLVDSPNINCIAKGASVAIDLITVEVVITSPGPTPCIGIRLTALDRGIAPTTWGGKLTVAEIGMPRSQPN